MSFIGKAGEYLVLAEFLLRGDEAYLAIKANQDDYDITVVTSEMKVLRIQVKTTEARNRSTNNAIAGIEKNYDFLILVVVIEQASFYVLSRAEAIAERGSNKQLGVTQLVKGTSQVKSSLKPYKNAWHKIA